MDTHLIFISHATKDDAFVKELRLGLEGQGLAVWVDSRNLRGGDKLKPEIEKAIEQARAAIVVLSPNTVNSPWVSRRSGRLSRLRNKGRTMTTGLSRSCCRASSRARWECGLTKSL